MRIHRRRSWTVRHTVSLLALAALTMWVQRFALMDMVAIGWRDEEQSHIFLAPLVALWLLWLRRTRFRYLALESSIVGPATVALGCVMSWWGFQTGVQIAWHGGAMLALLGVVLSFTGPGLLWLFGPVVLVMGFMLPVPGLVRHHIALPLQQHVTAATHGIIELMGVTAVKSGNVLIINGQQVAVGEACNGMRMVFALTLVVYAFAFGTPLRPATRVMLLACSPFIAMFCNVLRLVPTSLIYGYGSPDTAELFHDLAGWVMLPIALLMLAGLLKLIRWLEFPVTSFRLAAQ